MPSRLYNAEPSAYLRSLDLGVEGMTADIATIEFDEFGTFWHRRQLEDAIALVRQRNREAQRGVIVVMYVHGWMNNADRSLDAGDLATFEAAMRALAVDLHAEGDPAPDRLVGVYLGWRGATTSIPLWRELTFWDRKDTAERIASYHVRETFFRLTKTAKERADSKVLISGHSMGGMIVAKTLGPSLSTLLLAMGDEGIPALADMVLLQNPALDALSSLHFIEFLKRWRAKVELRHTDGTVQRARGPIMVSITSEADWVTRLAYPLGQWIDYMTTAVRGSTEYGVPSQWQMATETHGHLDYLVSHRAWVEDGEIVLEPVPAAFNTTPFWVVQVSKEISRNHSDVHNPRFVELVERLTKMNRLYDSEVKTWIRAAGPGNDMEPIGR
ncbi:MAG: hypothetical protein AAF628_21500 [Planctomycetota bacterium]